MNRLHPSMLSFENQMADHLAQEEDREARELFAVIAQGEGISEEEAEAIFIEELNRMSRERTVSEKLATVAFVMGLIALGIWFFWEFAMEATK